MQIVNDLNGVKSGDKVVACIPRASKYAPSPGKRYYLNSNVIAEVVECKRSIFSKAIDEVLSETKLPKLVVIKDGEEKELSPYETFIRCWKECFSKHGRDLEVYIITFRVEKAFPKFYNASTGFYDYPAEYNIDQTRHGM